MQVDVNTLLNILSLYWHCLQWTCKLHTGPVFFIEQVHWVPQSKLSTHHSSLSQGEEIIADGPPMTKEVHLHLSSKSGWLKPTQLNLNHHFTGH